MEVVLLKEHGSLKVAELVEEKPKTYKVKRIDSLKFENRHWGGLIKKGKAIYIGELLPVADLIDKWNTSVELRDAEHQRIVCKYNTIFKGIEEKINALFVK